MKNSNILFISELIIINYLEEFTDNSSCGFFHLAQFSVG